jgi:hypothetical protein
LQNVPPHPKSRWGLPWTFWSFVFLVVFINFVVYLLLVANGTSINLALAGAMVEMNLVLIVGAISLYSWIKIKERL